MDALGTRQMLDTAQVSGRPGWHGLTIEPWRFHFYGMLLPGESLEVRNVPWQESASGLGCFEACERDPTWSERTGGKKESEKGAS